MQYKQSNQWLEDHGKTRPGHMIHNSYGPLENQDAIEKSVHWELGLRDSFVITAGDIQLLPRMLDAADRFEKQPSDAAMEAIADEQELQPLFSY